MKRKHIFLIVTVIICILITGLLHTSILKPTKEIQTELSDKLLRFHVIANSDRQEDQALKMKVKEAVLDEMRPYLSETETREEAEKRILEHLNSIIDTANKTLLENESNQEVHAQIETSYFPTKTYGDFTFPPGNYRALRITLGEAEGKNWWCVMYPPLCFVDASYGTVPEGSKNQLKGLLTDETYDSIQDTEKPIKIGFRLFPFLNNLFSK